MVNEFTEENIVQFAADTLNKDRLYHLKTKEDYDHFTGFKNQTRIIAYYDKEKDVAFKNLIKKMHDEAVFAQSGSFVLGMA